MSLALKLATDPPPPAGVPLTVAQETLIGVRHGIVQDWRAMCVAFERAGVGRMVATREFLLKHPGISKSTLYTWDKLLRDDLKKPPADRLGLRVLLDRRTHHSAPITHHSLLSDPAWSFFKSVYNAMPPQTVVTCWHITKAQADKNGWAWPSLRTVQLRVAEPAFQVRNTFFRLGEREWSRQYAHQIPRALHEYRAGQHVMSDFHQAHQFCRQSDTDISVCRPLIAGTEDIRSRKAAFHVCLHENQREVLAGLAKWIREHGCPEEWTIDNGKPYRSLGISGGRQTAKRIDNEDYVRSVAGQLGIAVHFSINHNPNGKTYIERLFSTLEQQVRFPGWCGSEKDDIFKAADKLAQDHPEQLPTVAEYAAAVARWQQVYHDTPHGGECMEGLSPNQAFEQFDPIPLAVAPPGVLDQLLMLTAKAKVTNMGVLYKGVRYSNYDGLFDHMGSDVLLRIPETDAGKVLVCDLKTGAPICEAVNARLQITGTQHDHVAEGMRVKSRAKKLMKAVRSTDMHAAHRSVVDNALAARAADPHGGTGIMPVAATGTHDSSPITHHSARNLRPLRRDALDALAAHVAAGAHAGRTARPVSPPAPPAAIKLEDLYADEPAAVPGPKTPDLLEELYGA